MQDPPGGLREGADMPLRPPLVDTPERLQAMLEELRDADVLAMDAEMDSYYSFRPKLCLIQISTTRADYLVDPLKPLDFSGLGEIAANPRQVKVFHAGENDIPYFRERLGIRFVNLFDTHHAARVLGYPRCGLAPLLEEHFGVTLDKRFQTADWRLRPLPSDQDEYARMDTRYLLPLRELLLEGLVKHSRLREAEAEFERVPRVEFALRGPEVDGWARVKGARQLPPAARAILRELYAWRETAGEREDTAVFRILPDPLLLSLALRAEDDPEALRASSRHRTVQQRAEEIASAIARGKAGGAADAPLPKRGKRPAPMSASQQDAYQKLREWRNQEAQHRAVEPDRVASNRLLKRIAMDEPRDLEGLEQVEGMESWRMDSYGEDIVAVLRGARRRRA